jgi:glutamine phosphoribosylpyrophosphate amidotransferase
MVIGHVVGYPWPSNPGKRTPSHDCEGKIAVVHNGILENYKELKDLLELEGHHFTSQLIQSYCTSLKNIIIRD